MILINCITLTLLGAEQNKKAQLLPRRTVRLKCLSTLQGPGWAGRGRAAGGMGRREEMAAVAAMVVALNTVS